MSLRDLLKISIALCSFFLAAPILFMILYETIVVWMVPVIMLSFCVNIFLTILYLIVVIEEADYDDQYVKMSSDRYNKRR